MASHYVHKSLYMLWGTILIALLMAFWGIFGLAVGFDEAWIASSPAGLGTDGTLYYHDRGASITTGGLYLVFQAALVKLFGVNLTIARLFCFVCFLYALCEIYFLVAKYLRNQQYAVLVIAVLFAIPGTLVLPALALGVMPAFAALVLAFRMWDTLVSQETPGSNVRLALVGILVGLAAGTRMQFAVAIPAFFFGALAANWKSPNIQKVIVISIVASIVFLATKFAVLLNSNNISGSLSGAGGAIGVTRLSLLDDAKITRYFLVLSGFMPFSLIIASTGIALCLAQRNTALRHTVYPSLLFAWGVLALWLVVSPHPHIRYVWPSLAIFAIYLGCGLALALHEVVKLRLTAASMLITTTAIFCVVSGIAISARYISAGDSNNFHWELAGDMALLERPESFTLAEGQLKMAEYISNIDRMHGVVFSIGLPAIELQYLADRKIFRFDKDKIPANKDVYVVVGPDLGTYLQTSPEVVSWLKSNAVVMVEYGRYTLFSADTETIPNFELRRPGYVSPANFHLTQFD